MGIADLQDHHDKLTALEATIRTMVANREFPAVFCACLDSFEHIVPAIKYRKQRGIAPETPDLFSFSVICRYGPPLFEHAAMESLLAFVDSTRMLAKHENGYLSTIQAALQREKIARVLWNDLEQHPDALRPNVSGKLGVTDETAVDIVEVWEQLGVIIRRQEQNAYRLHFRSRLDAEVEGVCPACGVRGRGRKELFLRPISCKKCGANGYYHIKYTDPQ